MSILENVQKGWINLLLLFIFIESVPRKEEMQGILRNYKNTAWVRLNKGCFIRGQFKKSLVTTRYKQKSKFHQFSFLVITHFSNSYEIFTCTLLRHFLLGLRAVLKICLSCTILEKLILTLNIRGQNCTIILLNRFFLHVPLF